MANLVFSDLQNEVYAHTGLDSSDTTNNTNVNRWLNYTQQDICARWPWPFMEAREDLISLNDETTGTVSINGGNSSVSVTGTGTFFRTEMGDGTWFIQFSSANDWYNIQSFVSSTSLNLERAYQPSANLVNGTYIIRKFFYPLSSSADRIIDVRNWGTPLKLVQVDARTIDDIRPNPQSTNSSYGYIMWGYNSSGNILVTPYPFPSDRRLFETRTIKRPTDMVNSGDSPSIPNKYAHVLAWGAISIGFAFLRMFEEAAAWSQKFERRISEMVREFRMSEDYQPVLRSIDSIQRSKYISLPEQYPVIPT